MEQLPQEIVDAIVDCIPEKPRDEFLVKHDTSLLGYALVNRAFSAAARRRLFSTIYIDVLDLKVNTPKLQSLLDLLQSTVFLVQTFSLKLTTRKTYGMLRKDDILLSQIICTIKMSPRLSRLCIGGDFDSKPTSINTLGQRSSQAIQNMLPKIQDISLSRVVIPYNFFQDVQVLPALRLESVEVKSPGNSNTKSILPQTIGFLITRGHESLVHEWYANSSQRLPGFCKFRIEDYGPTPLMFLILRNSVDTLTTLEIQRTQVVGKHFTPDKINLSLFVKLTTISLSFDVASSNRPLNEARRVLELAVPWLYSKKTTLTRIEFTINHLSWVPLYDEGTPFDKVEPLIYLNPVQLRKQHPNLQSLVVNIPLSRCKMHLPHKHQMLKEDLRRALASMKMKLEIAILGSLSIAGSGVSVCVGGTMGPDMENVTTLLAGH